MKWPVVNRVREKDFENQDKDTRFNYEGNGEWWKFLT